MVRFSFSFSKEGKKKRKEKKRKEDDDANLFSRYSVYQLEEPIVVHKVDLRLYVKHTLPDGSILWKDLSNGSIIR